ncbi:MAG: GAF domain-containing sensor histidine kinase [Anaerolineae bacterium]|nr:GAF domain-containing sensor histidine kinase [Anaerolineae bacterium]
MNRAANRQEIQALRDQIDALEAEVKQAHTRIISLEAIQAVAQSLTSDLKLDRLLHQILAQAVRVTDATAGSLLLLDELTDELVFAVVEGGGGEKLKGARITRETGIAGWVATHRTPLIVDDVNQDNRYYQSIANVFGYHTTSLLCVPMISHNKLSGVLQVVRNLPNRYFNNSDQELLTAFASGAAITIENARLYDRLKDERDKLIVVEEEIRRRLARDLHDGPTQFVAAIIMTLGYARELHPATPEAIPEHIDDTIEMADQALVQLRTLLFDLRPVVLETQGLVPALEVYTERLRDIDNLNILLDVDSNLKRLAPRAEVAIFAVIQEAVNNAKKHAESSSISISLRLLEDQDALTVVVSDDGQGFDIKATNTDYDKRGSLGLINMKERMDAVNGTLTLRSTLGQGTQVILGIPQSENLASNP